MHSAIKNTLVSELQKGKMLLYLMSQTESELALKTYFEDENEYKLYTMKIE